MSYSKEVYVGVYIECKNELVNAYKIFKFCNNEDCSNIERMNNLNFCPLCGEKLDERKLEDGTKQKIQFDIPDHLVDVVYNINQSGRQIDKDIYISNSNIGRIKSSELNCMEIFELSNLDHLSKCIEEFIENQILNSFLSLCIKTYGKENVDLKFGVLVYYS